MTDTPKPIDHRYTSEIVCPYCGHQFRDSWEVCPGDSGEDVECRSETCGKTFLMERLTIIEYVTEKKRGV
jgi:hypothetical protein